MSTIFFQSSMPRAGSTLLQNVLAQNPEIYATPTSGVLELVFSARQMYTESLEFKAQDTETMNKGFINFCREGMHGWYDVVTDKPYVVDKSRGWGVHYDFLDAILGYQRTISDAQADLYGVPGDADGDGIIGLDERVGGIYGAGGSEATGEYDLEQAADAEWEGDFSTWAANLIGG